MKENADKARSLDTAAINQQLREQADQAFKIRFQMSMGQTEGLKKLRSLRKERARMLTVLRERELHGTAPVPVPAKAEKKAKAKAEAPKAAKPKAAKAEAPKAAPHTAKTPAVKSAAAPKKVAVKKAPAQKPAAKSGAKSK
jgi:large subunit ribosomal protein L29